MTQIIFTGAAGSFFLIVFSLLFVWLDERSKKRTRRKSSNKFMYFDKYYNELERESERNLENKRKERMHILGYNNETHNEKSGNDIAAIPDNAAV